MLVPDVEEVNVRGVQSSEQLVVIVPASSVSKKM